MTHTMHIHKDSASVPVCPKCGAKATTTQTRYGRRHSCCGLHSWDGKPLVSTEIHAARIKFHDAFDCIWRGGKCNRNKAYHYLAHVTGLPETECHGAKQESLDVLDTITQAALNITSEQVNKWRQ
jgi:hypothetical protein